MMTHAEFRVQADERERRFVKRALVHHAWGCRATAEALAIAPTTLLTTINRLGLYSEYKKNNPGRGRRK